MSEPKILELEGEIIEVKNKSGISLYNDAKQAMPNGLIEISFPDTDFKVGSALEKSGNGILVKKAGLVFVTFKIMLNSAFDENQNIQILLQCGSKEKYFCVRPSSTSSQHAEGSALFNANINDKIIMKFRNYGTGSIQISDTNATYGNRLEAFMI